MGGRVLFLTSNFPRWEGDSTTPFILNLARDLQAEGWSVDVLAPGAAGAARSERLDGVLVERFPYLWPPSAQTICYGGGALVNLRANPLNKVKIPALVLAELAATSRRLRARRYDILHSHWILPQGFTGAAVSRRRGPHVLTAHGGDVFALQSRLLQPFKRYALHGADVVTCNSSVTANAVQGIAPGVRTVRVIPMGVDVEIRSRPHAAERLRERHQRGDGPLVLFVGRLVEEKGVEDLIRAISTASQRLPDVTGLIVGDGQHRSRFEQLANDIGVADRISFTGWVNQADVSNYLSAADILAAPSRRAPDGWVEGQGLSIAEGMAHGLPVVATNSGGIPDVIADGRTGLLVPEASPSELAAAFARIWRDRSFAEALGRAARETSVQQFSRKASAEAFSDLFTELLAQRRSRQA